MKKQIVKHFSAVLSLCAAVMIGVTSGNTPDPKPEPGNGESETIITIPSVPNANEIPGNMPGVTPQDDDTPKIRVPK